MAYVNPFIRKDRVQRPVLPAEVEYNPTELNIKNPFETGFSNLGSEGLGLQSLQDQIFAERDLLDQEELNLKNDVAPGSNTEPGSIFDTGVYSDDGYFDKLAKYESGGNYEAYNKGSKAFGKYQFIPATEKAYAKKLGFTIEQARTPEGQEAMARRFTDDNKRGLEKAGIPVTDFWLYTAHQQGLGGAKKLHSGQAMNKRNVGSNLPEGGPATNQNWKNQWSDRFSGSSVVKDDQVGLSTNEMEELDAILGQYAYRG